MKIANSVEMDISASWAEEHPDWLMIVERDWYDKFSADHELTQELRTPEYITFIATRK